MGKCLAKISIVVRLHVFSFFYYLFLGCSLTVPPGQAPLVGHNELVFEGCWSPLHSALLSLTNRFQPLLFLHRQDATIAAGSALWMVQSSYSYFFGSLVRTGDAADVDRSRRFVVCPNNRGCAENVASFPGTYPPSPYKPMLRGSRRSMCLSRCSIIFLHVERYGHSKQRRAILRLCGSFGLR